MSEIYRIEILSNSSWRLVSTWTGVNELKYGLVDVFSRHLVSTRTVVNELKLIIANK